MFRVTKKNVQVKLADVEVNMFVRQELDHDHVQFLKGLVDANVEFKDRIQLIEKPDGSGYVIFNGRHRKEAFFAAGISKFSADIGVVTDELDFIYGAYAANLGGSKPPTPADTEHTISLLVERGETLERMSESLGLPKGMVRDYVAEVKSRLKRAKLQRASSAILNGNLTVDEAVERFKVDKKDLKLLLSGRVNKKKKGVDKILRDITSGYKSATMRNQKVIRSLTQAFEDGDVEDKHVYKVLDHIAEQQKRGEQILKDLRQRFDLKSAEVRKAAVKTGS